MEMSDTTASRNEEKNNGMNNQFILNDSLKVEVCVDINTFGQLFRDCCDEISK